MTFSTCLDIAKRKPADMIVLPFFKGAKHAEPAAEIKSFKSLCQPLLNTNDFTGKEGQVALIYCDKQPEQRIALLGLGEEAKISVEKLRRAYGSLTKECRALKIKEINLVLPHTSTLLDEAVIKGVSEGILLSNYVFDKLKSDSLADNPTVLLSKITLIGADKSELAAANYYATIAEGVYLARNLVNDNADNITPKHLSELALQLAQELPNVKTTIFDKKRLEKEKMGLILAVGQASPNAPALIFIEYRGNPKSKELTGIVGKGVTYDTGGLNLKPTGSMETMKCDMGGAATVLGTILALAKTGTKANVIGVIPTVENCIGPNSYKPGDVYKSYSGKTVEIANTDAEGRLILADAFAYLVANYTLARVIDFATLTGAIDIALGSETTGLFATQDALADALIQSGFETHERLCRLPLYEEYREALKSDVADIRNVGGRPGGAIIAAMFLKQFIGEIPWAHCDIASTAYLSDGKRYLPKHGTGVGVRLMLDFFNANE